MLHHPFKHYQDLKRVGEGQDVFKTFAKAYDYCRSIHNHPDDYYGTCEIEAHDEGFEEAPDDEPSSADFMDWNEVAREMPNHGPGTREIELLGNRAVDNDYDWKQHVGLYPDLYEKRREFWKVLRANHSTPIDDTSC